jgi:hypothetical protein
VGRRGGGGGFMVEVGEDRRSVFVSWAIIFWGRKLESNSYVDYQIRRMVLCMPPVT